MNEPSSNQIHEYIEQEVCRQIKLCDAERAVKSKERRLKAAQVKLRGAQDDQRQMKRGADPRVDAAKGAHSSAERALTLAHAKVEAVKRQTERERQSQPLVGTVSRKVKGGNKRA